MTSDRGEILVASGELLVPPGTPTYDYSYMEEHYRHVLWPHPKPGYQRSRRDLWYNYNKTVLHYRIYDNLSTGKKPCASSTSAS